MQKRKGSKPVQIACRSPARQESWKGLEDFEPRVPDEDSTSFLWSALSLSLPSDEKSIQRLFIQRAHYDTGLTYQQIKAQPKEQFTALSLCVRDRLIERWQVTEQHLESLQPTPKRLYFLSLEFVLGRSLMNLIDNLQLKQSYERSLINLGIDIQRLRSEEPDPGLGAGSPGRWAACLLDSLATMGYPASAYGIRYSYGPFQQTIKDGYQCENPYFWIGGGYPWEIQRRDLQYNIPFYGKVTPPSDSVDDDSVTYHWEPAETVIATAFDVPIPGYNTTSTINLRLWSAQPSQIFQTVGDYASALRMNQTASEITAAYYQEDNTPALKELMLKQQYFFVSACLQDILAKFKSKRLPINNLPSLAAVHLNDTDPALGIIELMRILMDIHHLPWRQAWELTQATFSYTNHSLLPPAPLSWDIDQIGTMLPRHLCIIYKINHHFLLEAEATLVSSVTSMDEIKASLSLIDETPPRCLKMLHLAVAGSHHTVCVSDLHSSMLSAQFSDFLRLRPDRFLQITNGVTQRRWLKQANPSLTNLITKTLGTNDWIIDFNKISDLLLKTEDQNLITKWLEVKKQNKQRLADFLRTEYGLAVDTEALFDVHIKRVDEPRRQLLNILQVGWQYRKMKAMSDEERAEVLPRVVIFAGTAASADRVGKLVIKLINLVATAVNDDPSIEGSLRVVFIPNLDLSLAELIIPAADISQHISVAGKEAVGTTSIKCAMNGGLILGSRDGLNLELEEQVGSDNIFLFGVTAHDVQEKLDLVTKGEYPIPESLNEVLMFLKTATFGLFPELLWLFDTFLQNNDKELISVDWEDYLAAHTAIDQAFRDKQRWAKMSLSCAAGMGFFSIDRCAAAYANNVWGIFPCPIPAQSIIPRKALLEAARDPTLDILSPRDFFSPRESILEPYSPSAYRRQHPW